MKPYTAFRKRLEFVAPSRGYALAAGAELLEAADADRVVVLADGADEYAFNVTNTLRVAHDSWCPIGGGVWCGVITRRRLVALVERHWPDLDRAIDALRAPQPPGRGWVFVLVVAFGGGTLLQLDVATVRAT